jgi:hypothetical protein
MSRFLATESQEPVAPPSPRGEGAIVPLPHEELEQLLGLALDGDMRQIIDLCARLTEENPVSSGFCQEVAQLATEYRDAQLLTYLNTFLDDDTEGKPNHG